MNPELPLTEAQERRLNIVLARQKSILDKIIRQLRSNGSNQTNRKD